MANPYNFFIDPFKGLNKVVTTYTSGSGNWTCPAGVTSVYVECWGASGGSEGSYVPEMSNNDDGGYGSGGGAYAAGQVSVTPGNNYAYVVGAGGTAGKGKPYAAPGAGGSSTFNSTSIVAVGSSGTTGGAAASCTGTVKYSGGNGSAADTNNNYPGAGGSSAGPLGNGVSASTYNAGVSSDPDAGDGAGLGFDPAQRDGIQGTAPGGGSGGSFTTAQNNFHNGAAGRPGQVRITYYL